VARGLIFDCDGVLVDSEPLAAAEIGALLQGQGAPITLARIYDEFLGRSFSTITDAARAHGVDLGPALPGYATALAERFRRELQPVHGMAEVLARLSGPRAVASSSAPERLSLSLSLTGLASFFGQHVYSAVQVSRGKPAPDLFLFAAKKLGVDPADCVVIEDSPAGLRAARAAGMRVIGFLGGSHAGPARLAEKLAQLAPDALIDRASDLPKTLDDLD